MSKDQNDIFKLIQTSAKQAIDDELQALQVLNAYVDNSFAEAVNCIFQSSGRLVVTGIGKSAIIGQKIVATLNSTGQPSIFMHAADAIHGDLGIIQKGDVVLAISKSGNTPEITYLCPILKRFGNPLIGMVGKLDSDLAKMADFVINTTTAKEACPNNLAPTTSTTAQVIMGDALAVSLLKLRNFGPKDFGKYHPGGALGKKLYLTCADIARNNASPLVNQSASFKEILHAMTAGRLGATAVGNVQNIAGIITDGDIRRAMENMDQINTWTAEILMHIQPQTIEGGKLATEAASIMQNNKISQIIVLENNQYLGMVHIHDLYKEGIL